MPESQPFRVVVDDPRADRKYTFEFIRAESEWWAVAKAVHLVLNVDVALRQVHHSQHDALFETVASYATAEAVDLSAASP